MSSVPMQLGPADETNASLQLVAREIAAELNEARLALEAYAERPEERGLLDRFAGHLHLGRGALRIAEVYGGSLLAEEMEHVAHYISAHASQGSIDTDGLDALMRAMEQLPAYLDRVASGGRDVPLALLPLLNDLRAVRGGALLSEGTLQMLNLHSDEPARPIATGPAGEMSELAKRLRPRFQRALLGWIRGDNVEQQLGAMSEIAEQFETASASQPVWPCTIVSVCARRSRRLVPSSAARSSRPVISPADGSGGVEAHLAMVSAPLPSTATRSVKVPPTSIPMR